MQPKITEDMLQLYTKELVDLRRAPGVIAHHSPNEGIGPVQWRVKLKSLGVLPGFADWIFICPRQRTFFLELKRPKQGRAPAGVQSPAQKEFEQGVTRNGYAYFLAYTPEQIETILTDQGAIRPLALRSAA